jgi:hypothetical protein
MRGDTWGSVYMDSNFSSALYNRHAPPFKLTNTFVYEYSLNSFWRISELYVLADLQSSNSNLRLNMVSSTIQFMLAFPRQLAELSYVQNTQFTS